MSEHKPYVYVLVRTDLSLKQQVVQSNHASLHAGYAFNAPDEIPSIVVCAVPDRAALEEAATRLSRYGIDHELFSEPDWYMGNSALATRPVHMKKERYVFSKYPLWGTDVEPADTPAVRLHPVQASVLTSHDAIEMAAFDFTAPT